MTTETIEKRRKQTGREKDAEHLAEIMSKMRSWSELSRDLQGKLPAAVVAALGASRPELVQYHNGSLDEEQTQTLLSLVQVLLETNRALQMHAEELASLSMTLSNDLRGMITKTLRITNFAHFRTHDEEED